MPPQAAAKVAAHEVMPHPPHDHDPGRRGGGLSAALSSPAPAGTVGDDELGGPISVGGLGPDRVDELGALDGAAPVSSVSGLVVDEVGARERGRSRKCSVVGVGRGGGAGGGGGGNRRRPRAFAASPPPVPDPVPPPTPTASSAFSSGPSDVGAEDDGDPAESRRMGGGGSVGRRIRSLGRTVTAPVGGVTCRSHGDYDHMGEADQAYDGDDGDGGGGGADDDDWAAVPESWREPAATAARRERSKISHCHKSGGRRSLRRTCGSLAASDPAGGGGGGGGGAASPPPTGRVSYSRLPGEEEEEEDDDDGGAADSGIVAAAPPTPPGDEGSEADGSAGDGSAGDGSDALASAGLPLCLDPDADGDGDGDGHANYDTEDEGDPLMDLFETHNTRRVMFHVDVAPRASSSPPREDSKDINLSLSADSRTSTAGSALSSQSPPPSSNIRSFIRRIVFKGGRERDSEAVGIDGAGDAYPPLSSPSCLSWATAMGCLREEKASAARGGPPASSVAGGASFNCDPIIDDDKRAQNKPRSGRSCFNAFLNPRIKDESSQSRSSSCSSTLFHPRQRADNCRALFHPRDSAEVERLAASMNAEKDRGGSQHGDARKLNPDTIDRAMSRSTEAAAVARRAASKVDGRVIERAADKDGAFPTAAAAARKGMKRSSSKSSLQSNATSSTFVPDQDVKDRVEAIIVKAERAHHKSYRYERAIGYYLAALSLLSKAGYPDDHPLTSSMMRKLNNCHHAQSSLRNSANIVKMGIKHENKGEFVRALKMYTIAYRIRRDALGKFHPSLPVLLNMLGSVQVKRGELREAMQIYELALNGRPDDVRDLTEERRAELVHPATKSVTLRDMGMIYERWGDDERALNLYRESLEYVMRGRERDLDSSSRRERERVSQPSAAPDVPQASGASTSETGAVGGNSPAKQQQPPLIALDEVKFIRSHKEEGKKHRVGGGSNASSVRPFRRATPAMSGMPPPTQGNIQRTHSSNSESSNENGEMELYLDTNNTVPVGISSGTGDRNAGEYYYYDVIFPPQDETKEKDSEARGEDREKDKKKKKKGDHKGGAAGNDVNVAMTLHQVAQIYRRQGHYAAALSAYQVSLRGMKQALGERHPNVAAILGNLGNLHKEMGNHDQAYNIYQEVLGIETLHLGLTHPEVSVTLHNIATIESSRGRYADAITLYKQVVKMQQQLFGPNHISVAVTSSCMGDVYERMGQNRRAMRVYEESLRIRTEILGNSHVDVGRLLHKLGSLAQKLGDYIVADGFLMQADDIYDANDMDEDHPWLKDMKRDRADVQAHLSLAAETDQLNL